VAVGHLAGDACRRAPPKDSAPTGLNIPAAESPSPTSNPPMPDTCALATPRPCCGLVPAAPPSAWLRPDPPPLPCAPIIGLHQAPAHARPSTTITMPLALPLDLAVKPHLPLYFHPSQAPESVSHGPLKLPNFPTQPLPRRTAADEPPPRLRPTAPAGSLTLAIYSPNRAHLQVALIVLVLPHPFPLAAGNPPRQISAGKHPAQPREYIAIAKFFLRSFLLDLGTYLRELELTFVFKRLSIVKSI
jgi:hypothetical protein